jgi:EAL domain-containing protein (putative c-di-GMP-specific phosphodiesterase class I)
MNLRRPPKRASVHSSRRTSALFGAVEIVVQPIVDVSTGTLVAAEALSRFPLAPEASIDETFALAYAAGRGPDLEAACVRAALRKKREELPPHVMLTVNVSPDALNHPSVQNAFLCDLTGVVVEVTEHASADLAALQSAIAELRGRGARIAIDDASTGYAGLLRLTALRPDYVKLDRGLVTGARDSVEQSAVIEALVSLSHRIGAQVLGEGVEDLDDLTALAELDVDLAQGYYIGRPAQALPSELPDAMESCREARIELLRTHLAFAPASAADGIRSVTAALAGSARPSDLEAALAAAAVNLGIDSISLSTLSSRGTLREVSCTGAPLDDLEFVVSDYPATRRALDTGMMFEAHLDDPMSDPSEVAQMAVDGTVSMLLAPVIGRGQRLGILEFGHRSHRRWSSHDIVQANILAEHVANVLLRLGEAVEDVSIAG